MLIPEPRREDINDALEMTIESYYEHVKRMSSIQNYELEYIGYLHVNELEEFADLSSWMEEIEDKEDMINFRGKEWFNRMTKFEKLDKIPPILVIEGDDFVDIGDGRGRVTYANYRNIPIHVWKIILISE